MSSPLKANRKSEDFFNIIKKYENIDDDFPDGIIAAKSGEKVFSGTYGQCRKLTNEKSRKNVPNLKPSNLTGVYHKSLLNITVSEVDLDVSESTKKQKCQDIDNDAKLVEEEVSVIDKILDLYITKK